MRDKSGRENSKEKKKLYQHTKIQNFYFFVQIKKKSNRINSLQSSHWPPMIGGNFSPSSPPKFPHVLISFLTCEQTTETGVRNAVGHGPHPSPLTSDFDLMAKRKRVNFRGFILSGTFDISQSHQWQNRPTIQFIIIIQRKYIFCFLFSGKREQRGDHTTSPVTAARRRERKKE